MLLNCDKCKTRLGEAFESPGASHDGDPFNIGRILCQRCTNQEREA